MWVAVGASLLPVYLATLAPSITWANLGTDSGDLVTAAAVSGVAHPTGYPTYLLLVRLVQFVPLGTLAYRANLLSAFATALSSGLICYLVQAAYRGASVWGQAGGVLAGLSFGLAPLVWSQAVIAEVYALHALFIVVLLLALLPANVTPAWDWLGGLALGLGLGNHLTLALLAPAWLVLSAWRGKGLNARAAFRSLAGMSIGLLIYLYLPLRAAAQPPINWGNAANWQGFWWVVSAAPYRANVFGLPVAALPQRLQALGQQFAIQAGWLGLALAGTGLLAGWWGRAPRVWALTLWTAIVSLVFATGYNTADWLVYLLPVVLALAIWSGLGLAWWLEEAATRLTKRLAVLALAACVISLGVAAVRHLPGVDASRDRRAEAFAQAVFNQAPQGAMIFTNSDTDTFPLWYFHFAEGARPDVIIVVKGLLSFDWYRQELQAAYGPLVLPEEWTLGWKVNIGARNARPVCETLPDSTQVLVC